MGKTVAEAKGEVAYGAEFFRWFSEEAVRIHGRWMHNPAGGTRLLTIRKPVGPCLFITPWNFPLAMGTRKIGPAVAAGCTMVVKPAELTPLTSLMLAEDAVAAGIPAGVINVLTGPGRTVGEALISHPGVSMVSFTGSTPVGRRVMELATGTVKRVHLELGGKAPFVVFDDADGLAADRRRVGAVVLALRHAGEDARRPSEEADVVDRAGHVELAGQLDRLAGLRGLNLGVLLGARLHPVGQRGQGSSPLAGGRARPGGEGSRGSCHRHCDVVHRCLAQCGDNRPVGGVEHVDAPPGSRHVLAVNELPENRHRLHPFRTNRVTTYVFRCPEATALR
jgi:hypothetical protein